MSYQFAPCYIVATSYLRFFFCFVYLVILPNSQTRQTIVNEVIIQNEFFVAIALIILGFGCFEQIYNSRVP